MTYPVKHEEMLCFAIYRASHAFNHLYRPLLDGIGLTYPQYLVMVGLWERDNQSVKEIGRALSLESNTMTPILKRLEALELISRQRDPKDERSVRVRLTSEGRALAKRAEHIPDCIAGGVDFSAGEVKDLLAKMQIVQESLHRNDPVDA